MGMEHEITIMVIMTSKMKSTSGVIPEYQNLFIGVLILQSSQLLLF